MTKGNTPLDELLSDPMVKLVMARDRVKADELRNMIVAAVCRGDRPELPPAHVIKACQQAGLCAPGR